VGEDEALPADHLAGASAAEQEHRVLDAAPVQAVNVFRRDPETGGAQIAFDALQQRGQPHALMGTGSEEEQEEEQGQQTTWHGRVGVSVVRRRAKVTSAGCTASLRTGPRKPLKLYDVIGKSALRQRGGLGDTRSYGKATECCRPHFA